MVFIKSLKGFPNWELESGYCHYILGHHYAEGVAHSNNSAPHLGITCEAGLRHSKCLMNSNDLIVIL